MFLCIFLKSATLVCVVQGILSVQHKVEFFLAGVVIITTAFLVVSVNLLLFLYLE